ncbi:hypothetical protein LTR85_006652 [Meristemomyces frigidus]|nr:hypothetical protein LTR85_006652 [Meristemomyces frigidus]
MSKDVFPFERLPPELRNAIYELLIPTGNKVQVRRSRVGGGAQSDFKLRLDIVDTTAVRRPKRRATQPAKIIGPFLPQNGTAILRMNKLAYAEALPIIYGANTFVFNSMPSLVQFAKQAKRGVPCLRDVTLATCTTTSMARALPRLGKTMSLWRLTITLNPCPASAADAAKALFKGARAFVEVENDEAARRHRFELLRFEIDGNLIKARVGSWNLQADSEADLADAAAVKVKSELERWLIKSGTLERATVSAR